MKKTNLPVRHSPMEEQWQFVRELMQHSFIELPQKIDRRWIKLIVLFVLGIVLLNKDLNLSLSLGGESNNGPNSHAALTAGNSEGLFLNPDKLFGQQLQKNEAAEKQQQLLDYVTRFKKVAIAEMEQYGVPASITLAQGLLESNIGKSKLATKNNNHFGLKCFSRSCEKGHCSNFEDDHHKDFFRVFDSAWGSYRAHSKFLNRKRYRHLQELGTKDYRGWAEGLQKAGYATDKRYAKKLIRLIESLKLNRYDL